MMRMLVSASVLLVTAMIWAQATQPATRPAQPQTRPEQPQTRPAEPQTQPAPPQKRPAHREPEQKPRPNDTLVYVRLETSDGNIDLELNETRAPISVKNFLDYVDKGHYDGTIFHRVERNFVIQGGGLTPDLKEKPAGEPIKNEAANGLKNFRGTIAMARKPQLDSATTEFFFNLRWNSALDVEGPHGGYAVFGRVINGMDVVDKMAMQRTGKRGGRASVPTDPTEIKKAKRITKEEAVPAETPATAPATAPAAPESPAQAK
jgi:peptidyl-prolyl cis-trans isomerase A (cyclophilin A)